MELRQAWDLVRQASAPDATFSARVDAEAAVKYAAVAMKRRYDPQHQATHFTQGQKVYLKLGEGFDIPVLE